MYLAKTAIPIKDNNEDEFVISEVQNACFKKVIIVKFFLFFLLLIIHQNFF